MAKYVSELNIEQLPIAITSHLWQIPPSVLQPTKQGITKVSTQTYNFMELNHMGKISISKGNVVSIFLT
jgi:hypothetical protein